MSVQPRQSARRSALSEFWTTFRGVMMALCAVSAIGAKDEIAQLMAAELETDRGTNKDL